MRTLTAFTPKLTVAAFTLAGAMLVASAAHADATCTAPLAALRNAVSNPSNGWSVELTMHREDQPYVGYDNSKVHVGPNGHFVTFSDPAYWLFSNHSFDYNAWKEDISLDISPDGHLTITSLTFGSKPTLDMTCHGNKLMTAYAPGFGVWTLTFRDLYIPIG
jgi:hypothetical protein